MEHRDTVQVSVKTRESVIIKSVLVKHLFKSHKILGAPLHQQTIQKGLEARDVLSMNQQSLIRNDWDTTNIKALAQRRVVTLGGMGVCGHLVQPCHVWRLYQL